MAPEPLVVDTWGWLALADDREPDHVAVRRALDATWKAGGLTVTTDYILDEAFTMVYRRLASPKARRFMSVLEAGEADHTLAVERIVPDRFDRAKALRLRLRDKPLISFTDLTTMVMMQDRRLTRIVTADQHFRQVGLGFELVP
jgi:predicted nucleic acid-binding protein